MDSEFHSEPSLDFLRKKHRSTKSFLTDKAAKNVLAPFLRRVKKQGNQNILIQKSNEDYDQNFLQSKIKDVMSKLTFFCKDSLEVPMVINETSEILKDVTKSVGVSSYIVDENNEYLVVNPKYMPKNGRHTVKYKIGPGKTVAAFVAFSREFVIAEDVLGDSRFPYGIPGAGKTVKSVLCVPVLTTIDGKCIAVIELFRDSSQKAYGALDLQICVSMTGWMGAAIHQNNERLFLLKKTELSNYLTSLVEFFFTGSLEFDKFISDIIDCAKLSVQAERGSFYLMEEEVTEDCIEEIVADVYEEGIGVNQCMFKKRNRERFRRNSTAFVESVIKQGTIVNIPEAYNDPRFNKRSDIYGVLTKSVISVPLKGSRGVLGILQLVNKLNESSFTKKDELMLKIIAVHVYLVCQHNSTKKQLTKSVHRWAGSQELLQIQIKPCVDDLNNLRSTAIYKKSELPKGFFNFHWIVTGKERKAPHYTVFMFTHLLGNQFVDYDKLTEFVLMVKKSYRNNPYHNFSHAFTVCHCMFNILLRNREKFDSLQILAFLVATICHDSDHVGYTNNFLEMTNHWLAELYWESPLEHHHYDLCLLMIESSGLFNKLGVSEREEVNKLIKDLILATDLVQYFKNRVQVINLLKKRTFDWDNPDHKLSFFKIVMTVCDVSGQCKPFDSAKKVTEGLYREFYNQGDVEKTLGFSPLSMMDRERTTSIPENQIHFLSLVCIPSAAILVAVFPNTEQLLSQCMELKECWSCIQKKNIVEVWKIQECFWNGRSVKKQRKSVKRIKI